MGLADDAGDLDAPSLVIVDRPVACCVACGIGRGESIGTVVTNG
jgi:hypothetical protein